MKPSGQAEKYLDQLLAEWMLGEVIGSEETQWMMRGNRLEEDAVTYYEFWSDTDTDKVGFCMRDDGKVGASPDRLVGEHGGLEIKCPSAAVHASYLRGNVADEYRCQIQGGLWVCERDWWDAMSYYPGMPPAIVRVERNPEFIHVLSQLVYEFVDRLEEAKRVVTA